MELGSKVTLLEEEVAVLKGEIKTILQEVRTAVLARENPFANGSRESLHIPALEAEPPTPEPEAPQPEAPPKVIQLHTLPEPEQPDETITTPPFSGRDETDAARPMASKSPANRRWSVASLATLIAWTQETAARMDASDMDILLSLARYGGLINEELEATLTKLSAPLLAKNSESRPMGTSDYLLALRELSALIEEAEINHRGAVPLRKAS